MSERLTITNADRALKATDKEFVQLFRHGTLEVEWYRPKNVDRQKPHSRDEVYLIAAGSGFFVCGENRQAFEAGEVLFAPAGVPHRFEDFTDDFAVWVMFYGPAGGEAERTNDRG